MNFPFYIKGCFKVTSMIMIQPSAQISPGSNDLILIANSEALSTLLKCSIVRIISGDIKLYVPPIWFVWTYESYYHLETPKSPILIIFPLHMKIFAGLRSLWAIYWSWRYFSPLLIYRMIFIIFILISKLPGLFKFFKYYCFD